MKANIVVRHQNGAIRPKIPLILVLSCILGLYWFAFRNLPLSEMFSAVRRLNSPEMLALAGANLIIIWSMSLRWQCIIKTMGYAVPFLQLLSYRMAANTISFITPGPHLGGEPLQVHMLINSHGIPVPAATASVAVDRLWEWLINFAILLLSGIYMVHQDIWHPAVQVPVMWASTLFIFFFGIWIVALRSGNSPLTRVLKFITLGISTRFPKVAVCLVLLKDTEHRAAQLFRKTGGIIPLYGICMLIQWSLTLLEFWVIYNIVGQGDLTGTQLLAAVFIAKTAFLLPLPGGMGALEAGQVLLMTSFGLDPLLGFSACLMMRIRDLVVIGSGAGMTLYWMRTPTPLC